MASLLLPAVNFFLFKRLIGGHVSYLFQRRGVSFSVERDGDALDLPKTSNLRPENMSAYSGKVAELFHASSRIQKSSITVSISPSLPRCR